MRTRRWTICLGCGALLMALGGGIALGEQAKPVAPLPRGQRLLGIAVGAAEDGDYPKAFATARSAGMQSVTLALNWIDLETAPGQYKNDLLALANRFYPAHQTAVDLILRPVNTNRKEVPADLKQTAFDAPEMQTRFRKLLDDVFAQLPDLKLNSLAIGNEVDDYLQTDRRLWAQYTAFYKAAKAYVKAKRPDLKVGVVATFYGLLGASGPFLRALNADSDLILVTYYPLQGDFQVKDPAVVGPDFARLTRQYAGRPIALTEVGYPSGAACGSSEAKQAAFVRNIFQAWDAHAAQIHSLTFDWLTDLSPRSAAAFGGYYGVSSPAFAEFLRTLGLRTFAGSGQDKPAFTALKAEAGARGWPQTIAPYVRKSEHTGINPRSMFTKTAKERRCARSRLRLCDTFAG